VTVTTATRRIPSRDDDEFDAYLTLPAAGSGPGLLLLPEALGVNDYLRRVAARLAELGYVVLAPDVYWRLERNVELPHDEAGMARAGELLAAFDGEAGARDMTDALACVRGLPEVTGKAGAIGFCFGGLLAYRVACDGDPDCAVSYYGVGIDAMLDQAATLDCPTLVHFGTDDLFVPLEAVTTIRQALGAKPSVEVVLYEGAGHAFDNPHAPWHSPEAAEAAWDRTTVFLAEHLGAR
jgi:carboxymethylenebutenolidase